MKKFLFVMLLSGMLAAQLSRSYAAESNATVTAAQKEGKVVIYSSTDSASVEPLLQDFKALYPFLQVEYNDLNTTEIYNRFTAEAASGTGTADFMWSSAMDLQLQLASKGNALSYASPEISGLPKWAVWQNQAYGTTFEPVSIAYNKRLLPADAVPQSHADLIRLMKEKHDVYKEKIATFDPEKSGVGFLMMTQDAKVFPQFWDLAKGLGATGAKVYTSTGAMLEKVGSGEHTWPTILSAPMCCCARKKIRLSAWYCRRITRWCFRASLLFPRQRAIPMPPNYFSTTFFPNAAKL